MLTNRNAQDELLLSEIARLSPNQESDIKLYIYDARSYINALANRVTSGGYENTKDCYK